MARIHIDNRENKGGFGAIPAGEYRVKIESAEMKQGPKSEYVSLQLRVLDGEYANRVLFDNLILGNNDISEKRLNNFFDACGFDGGTHDADTNDLVGIEIIVETYVEDKKDGYGEKARVRVFKSALTEAKVEEKLPMPPKRPQNEEGEELPNETQPKNEDKSAKKQPIKSASQPATKQSDDPFTI